MHTHTYTHIHMCTSVHTHSALLHYTPKLFYNSFQLLLFLNVAILFIGMGSPLNQEDVLIFIANPVLTEVDGTNLYHP